MRIALDVFLILLFLVACFWVALFGTTGLVLAERARLTKLQGFFAGALLGPVGLIWLWIRTRRPHLVQSIATPDARSSLRNEGHNVLPTHDIDSDL
jgi:hypothetical protein